MDCNSANLVNPGFGETYVASEDMVNTMDSGFEVNLQYKVGDKMISRICDHAIFVLISRLLKYLLKCCF